MSQTAELARRVKPPPDAAEKFSKARALVAALWPFMTAAAMRLVPVWSPLVPTMAVDRYWRLYLNPGWVNRKRLDGKDAMSVRQFSLLIVGHELQHLLQMHPDRLVKYRGRMICINDQVVSLDNVANDLAINCNLDSFAKSALEYRNSVNNKRMDPIPVPTEALHPAKFVDDQGKEFPVGAMSELYADLLDRTAKANPRKKKGKGQIGEPDPNAPPDNGQGQGEYEHGCGKCGSGGGGSPGEWEDPTEADPTDAGTGVTVSEAEVIIRQTAQAAVEQEERSRGTVPGGVLFWAEGHLAPAKVPWEKLVKQKLRGAINWVNGQVDSTYLRRNRRTRPSPGAVIRPGYQRPLPKLIVVWDTCLHGDSPVQMWDGSRKAVADVRIGEFVVGYQNGVAVPAAVYKTYRYNNRPLLAVELADGRVIRCTGRHRFLTTAGEWVRAEELTPDMELLTLRDQFTATTRSSHEREALDSRRTRATTRESQRTDLGGGGGVGESPAVSDQAESVVAGHHVSPTGRVVRSRRRVYENALSSAEGQTDRGGTAPDGGCCPDQSLPDEAHTDTGRRQPLTTSRRVHTHPGGGGVHSGDHRRRGDDHHRSVDHAEGLFHASAGARVELEHVALHLARSPLTVQQVDPHSVGWIQGLSVSAGARCGDLRLVVWPVTDRDSGSPDHQTRAGQARVRIHRKSWCQSDRGSTYTHTDLRSGAGDLLACSLSQFEPVKVRRVGGAGTTEVFDLATTTENYLVDGVVCHNSGSMSHADHEMVMSELHAICRSSGLPAVPVIPCDAAASEVQWVRRVQDIKLVGGGGTDMVIGIEAAMRCVPDARLIIVLTDGYTNWPLAPLHGVRIVACLTQRGGGTPPDWIDSVYACD